MEDTKKNLVGTRIGLELLDGKKKFGRVSKWSKTSIWIIPDGYKKPIEVPRDIIVRSLILLEDAGAEADND